MKIQSMLSKINRVLAVLLLVSGLFLGTLTCNVPSSYAISQNNSSVMIAMDSDVVDDALGSGTTDKIEGKVQKDVGTVEKKFGDDLEDNIEGTTKQVKGRAKQDIGRTKNAIEEAGSKVEETSDNVVDAVKDFFGS
ncbi:unknown [Crocosphaera subtropica ATCC 51142]|uniref:CsbD-like domain-containing protein n=1 Tax=Crocosphaera subtropica (strain ATCC 51142 / BH68) TaxID=43989 RepID=B1X027_CROS5|nr:CsbD family protein [Crocosphaera subtropica]ACB49528.1 unknown [Crocosphaera subtropica ATCC 51142]